MQYKSNISYTHTHTHTHTHAHTVYSMCVCLLLPASLSRRSTHTHRHTSPYVILDESWHHADFCKRLVVMATQRLLSMPVHLTSLTVCVHVRNKRRRKNKRRGPEISPKKKNNNKNTQQIKIAAGSLLSVCHDGFLQIVRALKINLKQTHTHTQRLSYVLCVCVLRFYPEALPQIPLQPFPAPPRPPQTSRGSNPHSKDSWYGNGSVKPQISLSTTHYRLLPPINVTACALWRQEAPLLTQIAAGMRRNV